MTAALEKLAERIEKLRNCINESEERGEDPHHAKMELDKILSEFNYKKSLLKESKRLLND